MSELVKSMLDNIINDNNAEAQENFNDAISLVLSNALDARKVEVAKQMGADNGVVQAD